MKTIATMAATGTLTGLAQMDGMGLVAAVVCLGVLYVVYKAKTC